MTTTIAEIAPIGANGLMAEQSQAQQQQQQHCVSQQQVAVARQQQQLPTVTTTNGSDILNNTAITQLSSSSIASVTASISLPLAASSATVNSATTTSGSRLAVAQTDNKQEQQSKNATPISSGSTASTATITAGTTTAAPATTTSTQTTGGGAKESVSRRSSNSVGKFKEKRPEPLKLNPNLNQEIPLDLSVKSAGNVPSGTLGNIFNLASLGPHHLHHQLNQTTTLETPRIQWQDNEDSRLSGTSKSRNHLLLSNSTSYSSSSSSTIVTMTNSPTALGGIIGSTNGTGALAKADYHNHQLNHHHHHHQNSSSQRNQRSSLRTFSSSLMAGCESPPITPGTPFSMDVSTPTALSSALNSSGGALLHSPFGTGSGLFAPPCSSPLQPLFNSPYELSKLQALDKWAHTTNRTVLQYHQLRNDLRGTPRRSCSTDSLSCLANQMPHKHTPHSNATAAEQPVYGGGGGGGGGHGETWTARFGGGAKTETGEELQITGNSNSNSTNKKSAVSPLATKSINSKSYQQQTPANKFSYSSCHQTLAAASPFEATAAAATTTATCQGGSGSTQSSPTDQSSSSSSMFASDSVSNNNHNGGGRGGKVPTPISIANATANLLNINLNSPTNTAVCNGAGGGCSPAASMFDLAAQSSCKQVASFSSLGDLLGNHHLKSHHLSHPPEPSPLDPLISAAYCQQHAAFRGGSSQSTASNDSATASHQLQLQFQQQRASLTSQQHSITNNNSGSISNGGTTNNMASSLGGSTTLNTPTIISPSQLKAGGHLCFLASPNLSPMSSVFELPSPLLMFPPTNVAPPPPPTPSAGAASATSKSVASESEHSAAEKSTGGCGGGTGAAGTLDRSNSQPQGAVTSNVQTGGEVERPSSLLARLITSADKKQLQAATSGDGQQMDVVESDAEEDDENVVVVNTIDDEEDAQMEEGQENNERQQPQRILSKSDNLQARPATAIPQIYVSKCSIGQNDQQQQQPQQQQQQQSNGRPHNQIGPHHAWRSSCQLSTASPSSSSNNLLNDQLESQRRVQRRDPLDKRTLSPRSFRDRVNIYHSERLSSSSAPPGVHYQRQRSRSKIKTVAATNSCLDMNRPVALVGHAGLHYQQEQHHHHHHNSAQSFCQSRQSDEQTGGSGGGTPFPGRADANEESNYRDTPTTAYQQTLSMAASSADARGILAAATTCQPVIGTCAATDYQHHSNHLQQQQHQPLGQTSSGLRSFGSGARSSSAEPQQNSSASSSLSAFQFGGSNGGGCGGSGQLHHHTGPSISAAYHHHHQAQNSPFQAGASRHSHSTQQLHQYGYQVDGALQKLPIGAAASGNNQPHHSNNNNSHHNNHQYQQAQQQQLLGSNSAVPVPLAANSAGEHSNRISNVASSSSCSSLQQPYLQASAAARAAAVNQNAQQALVQQQQHHYHQSCENYRPIQQQNCHMQHQIPMNNGVESLAQQRQQQQQRSIGSAVGASLHCITGPTTLNGSSNHHDHLQQQHHHQQLQLQRGRQLAGNGSAQAVIAAHLNLNDHLESLSAGGAASGVQAALNANNAMLPTTACLNNNTPPQTVAANSSAAINNNNNLDLDDSMSNSSSFELHFNQSLQQLASAESRSSSATGSNSNNGLYPKSGGGAKKYHCDQCSKSFTRSDMLTRHRRLHSGDRPFQCLECKQEFSRSDHLSTHMRTHTGEKPYRCKLCSYSACRKDMITRHMKVHNRSPVSVHSNFDST